jgi:hypothetical protein
MKLNSELAENPVDRTQIFCEIKYAPDLDTFI